MARTVKEDKKLEKAYNICISILANGYSIEQMPLDTGLNMSVDKNCFYIRVEHINYNKIKNLVDKDQALKYEIKNNNMDVRLK